MRGRGIIMYVFILTRNGAKTNIKLAMKLMSLDKLIEYIKEDEEIKKQNQGNRFFEYIDKLNLDLETGRYQLRIGKIDDSEFQTRIIKFLTLEEFEEIFDGHIEDIKPLLRYGKISEGLFRGTILKKYGEKVGG